MTADDELLPPAPSISNREIWTCALQVMKQHGDNAPVHIAERIGALALAGDLTGVATWNRIADRVDQLTDYVKSGQRTRQ